MNKVAVIGFGNIATRHRRNLKLLYPAAELFAMSASGRNPSESVSDCNKVVTSISDLIAEGVQFVIVASPAPLHAQHAVPLIEAGIATLIEKPVTTTIEDANAIQEAIKLYSTPVAIGYCLRYLPSAKKLKVFLETGELGTLYNAHIEIGQYLPDWRPNKDYRDSVSANKRLGGGALFELSHELDYAKWLLGPLSLQHSIIRTSKELGLEVEDIVDILALAESGAVVSIHLDFLQRKAHRQCSFVGSEGRIDWDLIQNQLILTTATKVTVLYSEPEWDKNKMYLAMIDDFVRMIKGQQHSCTEVIEATSTVNFIHQVKQQFCKEEK